MGCSLNSLGFVVIIRLMYVYFISLKFWVVRIFGLGSAKEQDFAFLLGFVLIIRFMYVYWKLLAFFLIYLRFLIMEQVYGLFWNKFYLRFLEQVDLSGLSGLCFTCVFWNKLICLGFLEQVLLAFSGLCSNYSLM